MPVRWRIELLGELRVCGGGEIIDHFRTQKTAALLGILAYHLGRAQPREVLTELLWPDDTPLRARHKLSVALSSLRQQLEPPGTADSTVLVADRGSIKLNPAAVTTDVAEVEAHLQAAAQATSDSERVRHLRAAVDRYRGPLLPGSYEEWIPPEQQRLEALYFEAVRRLLPLLEQEGALSTALSYAIGAVAIDPLREEGQRQLVRLYAMTGQREAALRQYEQLCRVLAEELDAIPTRETQRLMQEIQALSLQEATDQSPSAVSSLSPDTQTPAINATEKVQDEDPIGGAVPPDSPFYVSRTADTELARAIARHASIVLLKGDRQVGKTSLLARALQQARNQQARVACTALQLLNSEQLSSADSFLQVVARSIAEQLGRPAGLGAAWDPEDGPNINFRRFMRRIIQEDGEHPLVWVLDDADRLFTCPFGVEIFALLRAWHNERALDPSGPWSCLTLVVAYATEAHLFIPDMNQSPFNVGMRLELADFTADQVSDLNRRYASPLRESAEINRFPRLVGGHPYLVRRGLLEMATRGLRFSVLESQAHYDHWIYGDHLRRMAAHVGANPELGCVMRDVLRGGSCPDPAAFYRLRSAGLLTGDTSDEARPRCELYARYLTLHLLPRPCALASPP